MLEPVYTPPPYVDLPEGTPANPPADTARLFSLDVNGITQVEYRDSLGRGARLAADNLVVVKLAAAVTRGQVVYISGAAGANPLVGLARSDNIATMPGIGLALDTGAVNGFIRVLLGGTMQQVDTSAFTEGSSLFVSATTAGAMTTTLPADPNYAQRVGFVTRSHATAGEILVMTTGVVTPPRLHAPTHASGGTDPVNVTTLAGFPGGTSTFLRSDSTFAAPPAPANVALTNAANTFTTGTQTINCGAVGTVGLVINGAVSQTAPVVTLNVPSGSAPILFFDHDGTSGNPSIRWRQAAVAQGLKFYRVNSGGTATESCRIQDNDALVVTSLETYGGLKFGSFYMQRGGSQRYELGQVGTSDQFHLNGMTDTQHQVTFSSKTSTTNSRPMVCINSTWADSTDASRKARTIWCMYDAGASSPGREVMRMEASGTAAMIGFLGAAAVVRPTVTGSRGGNAALASLLTALANLGLIIDSTSA